MTPEATARVEQARSLIETEGLTFTQVAKRLGTTKNAVIGLADRQGIKSPNPPGRSPRPDHAKPRAKAAKARLEALQRPPELPEAEEPLAAAWLALPGSTPMLLEHLTKNGCKWIVGDSTPALWCGLETDGGPWCPTHKKLAWKEK